MAICSWIPSIPHIRSCPRSICTRILHLHFQLSQNGTETLKIPFLRGYQFPWISDALAKYEANSPPCLISIKVSRRAYVETCFADVYQVPWRHLDGKTTWNALGEKLYSVDTWRPSKKNVLDFGKARNYHVIFTDVHTFVLFNVCIYVNLDIYIYMYI